MLQLGYFLFSKVSDIPETFMEILFDRLKVASQTHQAPIFHRLFDDHNIPKTQVDNEKLRELSNFVNNNPNYVLPSLLLKEPVHISKSIALNVSQNIVKDIVRETFGIEINDKSLSQYVYKVKVDKGDKPKQTIRGRALPVLDI